MLELYQGPLPVAEILGRWYESGRSKNYGAYITFVGTVRDENGIEGLSFDVYRPILEKWLEGWRLKAAARNAVVAMAHSEGDVPLFCTSYIAAVWSPKRRVALEMIDEFVEDFKAQAPIWKYDLRDSKRVFAADRCHALEGSGLLKA
ncbi:MAG: molybdenum cofactor biosynthesis protein MoaE [Campylobacterales bacterium]